MTGLFMPRKGLLYGLLLAAHVIATCPSQSFSQPDEQGVSAAAIDLTVGRFRPDVIRIDRTDPVLFEATLNQSVKRVALEIDGIETDMVDDGTNGDILAGDLIYTIELAATTITSRLGADDVYRPFVGYANVYDGAVRVLRYNVVAQVWTPDLAGTVIDSLAPNAQRSDHVFNMVRGDDLDPKEATNAFFYWFGDDFDFINVVYSPGYRVGWFHVSVQNSVGGIGRAFFNQSADYGSAGRLLGINVFPIPYYFDTAHSGFSHETAHQWMNYLYGTPLAYGAPHWPYSNLASGVMGFGGGTFAYRVERVAGGVTVTEDQTLRYPAFSSMDLYLMGLIPAGAVDSIYVFNNQASRPSTGFHPESEFVGLSAQDIIDIVGARTPSHEIARSDFRLATLVVSDELLSQEEMEFFDFFAGRADAVELTQVRSGLYKGPARPFYLATEGLATMDPDLGATIRNTAPPAVSVKVFLEGAYASDDMSTAIAPSMPLIQPFGAGAFEGTPLWYDGTENVSSIPSQVVDWVLVQLVSGDPITPPMTAAGTRVAFLKSTGEVVGLDGESPVSFFGVDAEASYVIVRHRNNASIMSSDTLDFSDGIASWDFTTAMSQAYAAGGNPMKDLGGGKFGMFACDANADGFVTAPDFNLWNAATTAGATGYEQADCNLDGFVTAPDFNLWNANTIAGAASQVPQVSESAAPGSSQSAALQRENGRMPTTVAEKFALHTAYPNPFNPSTTIRYDVPQAADVRLVVFDALGRAVDDLGTRHSAPGTYSVTWSPRNVPSGVYFVRFEAEAFTQTRRMILTK